MLNLSTWQHLRKISIEFDSLVSRAELILAAIFPSIMVENRYQLRELEAVNSESRFDP